MASVLYLGLLVWTPNGHLTCADKFPVRFLSAKLDPPLRQNGRRFSGCLPGLFARLESSLVCPGYTGARAAFRRCYYTPSYGYSRRFFFSCSLSRMSFCSRPPRAAPSVQPTSMELVTYFIVYCAVLEWFMFPRKTLLCLGKITLQIYSERFGETVHLFMSFAMSRRIIFYFYF